MWIVLSLVTGASAAEIQVATSAPINILVDGVPLEFQDGGVALVKNLAPGRHTVEARNMMGKTRDMMEVELLSNEQARFSYRAKRLTHIGTSALAGEPLALPGPAPVAVPTEQVIITETTVVDRTPTGGAVIVGLGMPGVGITVSDGDTTVSMGVGLGMGSIVVHEGGATTTTTTTTTRVVGAPVVETRAFGMESRPFQQLVAQLSDASFDEDRLVLIKNAVLHNSFTCVQIVTMLNEFSFDDDKLRAVQLVVHRTIDPENATTIHSAFTFSDDGKKALALYR